MIGKLVLGGTGTGDLPILDQPDALTSAPSSHIHIMYSVGIQVFQPVVDLSLGEVGGGGGLG